MHGFFIGNGSAMIDQRKAGDHSRISELQIFHSVFHSRCPVHPGTVNESLDSHPDTVEALFVMTGIKQLDQLPGS